MYYNNLGACEGPAPFLLFLVWFGFFSGLEYVCTKSLMHETNNRLGRVYFCNIG